MVQMMDTAGLLAWSRVVVVVAQALVVVVVLVLVEVARSGSLAQEEGRAACSNSAPAVAGVPWAPSGPCREERKMAAVGPVAAEIGRWEWRGTAADRWTARTGGLYC